MATSLRTWTRGKLRGASLRFSAAFAAMTGATMPPSGDKVATTRANAIRFVCDRVDSMFSLSPSSARYDILESAGVIEIARIPTEDQGTAIVHFRLEPEEVSESLIRKLASLAQSLQCVGVFFSWVEGYSAAAIEAANSSNLLLYRLGLDGKCLPANQAAVNRDQRERNLFRDLNWFESWFLMPALVAGFSAFWILPYLGPLALFLFSKSLIRFFGVQHYLEIAASVVLVILFALSRLVLVKVRGPAWRWPKNVARSIVAFSWLVVNIALLFAGIYLCLSEEHAKNFAPPLVTHIQALYFSSTTLTTVGYGDIKPNSDPARLATLSELAVTLTLIGVVFAGLGARLASRLGRPEA